MEMCKSLILCAVFAIGLASANIICPGAPSVSYGSGKIGCTRPICLVSGGGLRPSPDPTKYFVCAGPNISYEMRCAPGTCFSFEYQVCVHARDWKDDCHRSEQPATTTALPITESSTAESTTLSPITESSTAESTTLSPVTESSTAESTTLSPVTESSTAESTTLSPITESSTAESTTVPISTTEPSTTTTETTTKNSLSDGRYVQVCPGFDRVNLTYGEETCAVDCSIVGASLKMFPDRDPQYFQKCISSHTSRKERCPSGTCFNFIRQVCVQSGEWENFCSGLGI